jgi:hypothetical protein
LGHQHRHTLALVAGLAELGDHGIGRVRHNRANDTSKVARGERDAELRALGVLGTRLGEDVRVEHLDHLLEEEELGLSRMRPRDITNNTRILTMVYGI